MRFSLGINYWPRRSAMYAWQRFDLGEIREDMVRIRSLGLDTVRFFLLWEAFAPDATHVDARAVRRFVEVMDVIAAAGLRAMPTLFTGNMSGCNWIPRWALDRNYPHGRFRTISDGHQSAFGCGDFYTDPALLRAQLLLIERAGGAVRGHPALWVWDLGNEFSNVREPKRPEDAALWSRRLTDALYAASGAGATAGMHGEDLERDRHIRPSSIAQPWEFATMHGYSVYNVVSRGRLDTDVVPFASQLQSSLSGKPVLFSEMGNPTCPPGTVSPYNREPLPGEPPPNRAHVPQNAAGFACLTEEEMCAYAYGVIDRLHRRGALGAFWWCWADYAPELASLPPFDVAKHELHFGIVRNDGTFKPVAQALARIAREERRVLDPKLAPLVADEEAYYAGLPQTMRDLYAGYTRAYA